MKGERNMSALDIHSAVVVSEGAVGEVEEANATVGAAVCSGTVPDRFVLLLRDVQSDLLALAADLSAIGSDGSDLAIDAAAVQRVLTAVDEHRSEPVPTDFAVLGGSTSGVGLLRLARMTVRRAARSVRRLENGGAGSGLRCVGAYLDALAELLLVLAFESELLERQQLPVGWCGDGSGLMDLAHVVPRRESHAWLSAGRG
jgi:cob(I)alamin adenosyltransferase